MNEMCDALARAHEFHMKLKKAGLTDAMIKEVINSKDNELAEKMVDALNMHAVDPIEPGLLGQRGRGISLQMTEEQYIPSGILVWGEQIPIEEVDEAFESRFLSRSNIRSREGVPTTYVVIRPLMNRFLSARQILTTIQSDTQKPYLDVHDLRSLLAQFEKDYSDRIYKRSASFLTFIVGADLTTAAVILRRRESGWKLSMVGNEYKSLGIRGLDIVYSM